jgi:hypothetical protein
VTNPKGWHLVTATNVNPIVTIADLVSVTGLSRRTVRDMLTKYHVPALPRYGPRDTLRYQRPLLLDAIRSMPRTGNRKKIPPRAVSDHP